MIDTTPGALVRYREREWVILSSDDPNLVLLRPIGGSAREVCGVVKLLADLMGYEAPHERIETAQFPLLSPEDVQDHAAVRLLLESARLLLRDGAAPFRSLGHLSVRPRPYQFVPLVMALRQPTVRLLIAADVGVGKTIEAAPIAASAGSRDGSPGGRALPALPVRAVAARAGREVPHRSGRHPGRAYRSGCKGTATTWYRRSAGLALPG